MSFASPADDSDAWVVPGEYVVDFRDDVGANAVGTWLQTMGLTNVTPGPLADETKIFTVTLPRAVSGAGRLLAALRADPRVVTVEPNVRYRASSFEGGRLQPDDPMYARQWHMKRVGAEDAWAFGVGRGVTVAVVDTGIACENRGPFTKASDLWQTRCVPGANFVKKGAPASDDQGHGTHVAGTIAQSTNNGVGAVGLAFEARLMPVKVLSADGWGSTPGVAAGIRWAADHGADVINLSLGSPRSSKVLQEAIDHARNKGAVVVAAAGNNAGKVGYPGACEGVIGVSATDKKGELAWFSSRGKGVDIGAPGVDVLQQTICERGLNRCEQFSAFNGTSMASPHVAAAAALLVGAGITDPDAVERMLTSTADEVDSEQGHINFGHGRLRASDAVSRAHLDQILARLLAVLVVGLLAFRWARRKGAAVSRRHPAVWFGAAFSGVGLLCVAPWLASRHHLWLDVLSRPLGDWSLLLGGTSLHGLLPFADAAVPLVLAALFFRSDRMKPLLAGISIGTAGYLAALLALGHVVTPFGSVLTFLWCGGNALFCTYLGSLMLQKGD
ncbi:MAG: S8 family peptidase [Myxococcota bacterium]